MAIEVTVILIYYISVPVKGKGINPTGERV